MRSQTNLADVLEFVVDNRGKTAPTVENGVPLIATNCVSNDNLYPIFERVRYVDEDTYQNWFRSHPKPWDILLTNKGSKNGAVCLVPDPVNFCIAQDMVALRANQELIDPKYLFALLRSELIQSRIKNLNVDAVIPHFKKTDFDKLSLPLLDKESQKEIGEFYFSYSKKIHLNQQTNETLEAMAQAIFKSWFVDFDPVRAKIEAKSAGRDPNRAAMAAIVGVTLEQDWDEVESALDQKLSSMTEEQRQQLIRTAQLFPDKLVESEIGEVPKGWEVKQAQELVDIGIGKTPPRKEQHWFSEDYKDVKWISIKDMGTYGIYALDTSEYLTREAIEEKNVRVVPDNTVILSFKMTVGRTAITVGEMTTNEAIAHFKLNDNPELTTKYIFLYLSQFDFDSLGSTSSIAKAINSKIIKKMPILIPDKELVNSFTLQVNPIFGKIKSNSLEVRTLSKLRDTLLPKLISGEVGV